MIHVAMGGLILRRIAHETTVSNGLSAIVIFAKIADSFSRMKRQLYEFKILKT